MSIPYGAPGTPLVWTPQYPPFTALCVPSSAVCPLCPVYSVSTLPPTFPLFASSHHPASQTYVTDHCNPVSSNTLDVRWHSLHTPGEYKYYVVSNPSWGDLVMYYTWEVLTAHVGKTDLRARITGEIPWQHAFILFWVWQPTLGTWYKKVAKPDVSDYLYVHLLYSLICWHSRKQRDQGTPTDGCNLHTKPQVSKKLESQGNWFHHNIFEKFRNEKEF